MARASRDFEENRLRDFAAQMFSSQHLEAIVEEGELSFTMQFSGSEPTWSCCRRTAGGLCGGFSSDQ